MSEQPLNRRQMLLRSAQGLGAAAAAGPVSGLARGATGAQGHPLAPQAPHFAPKAKRVIMFFLTGGASHVDSFDPKPMLQKHGNDPTKGPNNLLPSPWKARPGGESGIRVTDLFPYLREKVDDLCLIRSMHGDHNCHYQATLGMHTGSVTFPRPSMGSWVSYGLGTYNLNLPPYCVIADEAPYAGSLVWDANFLPAYHQGVRMTPGEDPIPNLEPHNSAGPVQDLELALLRQYNQQHSRKRPHDDSLKARMLSFKTAFGLQNTAPKVFDLSDEPQSVLNLYGIDREDRESFGWQCLIARRLAERGVRFVELFDIGSHDNWDAHGNIESHKPLAEKIDRPIASLLEDLKQRGMLDETLVVFATEFGRGPFSGGKGRTHHNRAYTCWLAGGGVKGGHVHGSTDEYGNAIDENPVHVHDFHATILHLLGLDHKKLTYHHNGRDFRLTDVHGRIVKDLIA